MMCIGDSVNLQKSGTFQVIVPLTSVIDDPSAPGTGLATRVDSVTIPISLAGNYKLKLNFIEFNCSGNKSATIDNIAVFHKAPLVTFTSPNFSVPLTVQNAMTHYSTPNVLKTGNVNGISTTFDGVQFSTVSHGGGSVTSSIKTSMSKPGPPHWTLASIFNSFTIQPMYLISPGETNYQSTTQIVLSDTFGGNHGAYILTFEYDAI
jgi:hypothetical protein